MTYLLDTHALLWWLADSAELSAAARDRIRSPDHGVVVSAATVWEIAIKRALGKLECPTPLAPTITEAGFDSLPMTAQHAEAAASLPRHHDDPFDRMLVAQAREHGMTLVTRDANIAKYDVRVLRA